MSNYDWILIQCTLTQCQWFYYKINSIFLVFLVSLSMNWVKIIFLLIALCFSNLFSTLFRVDFSSIILHFILRVYYLPDLSYEDLQKKSLLLMFYITFLLNDNYFDLTYQEKYFQINQDFVVVNFIL